MKLLYVGDPMCSWCYGFGKEMTALMTLHPGLELEIIVGGVRAGYCSESCSRAEKKALDVHC